VSPGRPATSLAPDPEQAPTEPAGHRAVDVVVAPLSALERRGLAGRAAWRAIGLLGAVLLLLHGHHRRPAGAVRDGRVLMALASGRMLNALALGDDVARSLGERVGVARGFSFAAVVLLVGCATAAAGPIAFVGLTIPHVARAITGPDYRWALPYSAVLAPALLLGSDVVGRVIARPGEVQVGIVMALIGSPFFVALVRRRKLAEL
jgi:hypothetical protein